MLCLGCEERRRFWVEPPFAPRPKPDDRAHNQQPNTFSLSHPLVDSLHSFSLLSLSRATARRAIERPTERLSPPRPEITLSSPPLTAPRPRRLFALCPSPVAPMARTTTTTSRTSPPTSKPSDKALLDYIYSALGSRRAKEREKHQQWKSQHSAQQAKTASAKDSAVTGTVAETLVHNSWQRNGTAASRNLAANGSQGLAQCHSGFEGLANSLGQDSCYVSCIA